MIGLFQAGLLFILLAYLTNFFRSKNTDILTSGPENDIDFYRKSRKGLSKNKLALKLSINFS